MVILVSACLLGENCKYNGGNNFDSKLVEKLQQSGGKIISVCPEVLGGLSTPRIPSEVVQGVVINREGINVDREFRFGAERALNIAMQEKVDFAVLKANSPSCGFGQIYDGTFSGTKVLGNGIFADLLAKRGVRIFTEKQIDEIRQAILEGVKNDS